MLGQFRVDVSHASYHQQPGKLARLTLTQNSLSTYTTVNSADSFCLQKSKAKAQCDSLTKEAASYKEMLYSKEKELDVGALCHRYVFVDMFTSRYRNF